jgi:hypothetical protein
MRVMVIVKGGGDCASGAGPSKQLMAEMRSYNETLAKAGVLIAVDRLQPLSAGARVKISGAKWTAVDGPFPETKEVVGGFWLWQVESMDEAIEWIKRCPFLPGQNSEIEIRQVLEPGDFGPALTRESVHAGGGN